MELLDTLGALFSGWGGPVLFAVLFMLGDIGSGFAAAVKEKVVASGKMREGLWHKGGFCILIIAAAIYEAAVVFVDVESAALGIDVFLPDFPAVAAVCIYVMVTELVSICENAKVLNPGISKAPFLRSLAQHDPASDDLTVEIDDADLASAGRSE